MKVRDWRITINGVEHIRVAERVSEAVSRLLHKMERRNFFEQMNITVECMGESKKVRCECGQNVYENMLTYHRRKDYQHNHHLEKIVKRICSKYSIGVNCPRCNNKLCLYNLRSHIISECANRIVKCMDCDKEMTRTDYVEHKC